MAVYEGVSDRERYLLVMWRWVSVYMAGPATGMTGYILHAWNSNHL